MSNDRFQIDELLVAIENADTISDANTGRKIGRLQDCGIFLRPEDAAQFQRPAFLPSHEEWVRQCEAVRKSQLIEIEGRMAERLAEEDSSQKAGVVKRSIGRA